MRAAPSEPLSDDEYALLAETLDEVGALGIEELIGLCNAVAVGPNFVQPSTWLPLVLEDEAPVTLEPDAARDLVDLILRQYNEVVAALSSGTVVAPEPEMVDECVRFAAGFAAGAELDLDWIGDEELWAVVSPIAYLAGRHDLVSPDDLREFAANPNIQKELCEELGDLILVAHAAFRDDGSVSAAQPPIRRDGPRIGRNDPCPCGSGKKFKRCCGQ